MKNTIRILVVDDDPDFAEGLVVLLGLEGHDVRVAHSGEEAREIFRAQEFDLTLMDVRLPGMNGVESLLELQKIRPEANFVMMTAYSVESLLSRAIEAGALTVLRKPFDADELLLALSSLQPTATILLADDDRDFADGTARHFTEAGFKVHVAYTGQEALDIALSHAVDVLVLDLRLPILSGLEVYLKLKQLGRTIPTLIVTGYANEERLTIEKARQSSVKGHLVKPVEPSQLMDAVKQLIPIPGSGERHAPEIE